MRMIEKIIRDYLTMALSVPVYLERPVSSPASFVLLEKTGGSKTNHINYSTFAFQSYGASLYDAAALNVLVMAAVENLIELPEICSVRLNSNYNFSNTARKEHRYQAVYEITHY